MKKILVSVAVALPLFAGCAGTGADGKREPSVEQLVTNAEAQYKAAVAQGAAWTTTEKSLEEAKKAKEAMDTDKAVKSAKKVIKESQMAMDQAKANQSPKPFYN